MPSVHTYVSPVCVTRRFGGFVCGGLWATSRRRLERSIVRRYGKRGQRALWGPEVEEQTPRAPPQRTPLSLPPERQARREERPRRPPDPRKPSGRRRQGATASPRPPPSPPFPRPPPEQRRARHGAAPEGGRPEGVRQPNGRTAGAARAAAWHRATVGEASAVQDGEGGRRTMGRDGRGRLGRTVERRRRRGTRGLRVGCRGPPDAVKRPVASRVPAPRPAEAYEGGSGPCKGGRISSPARLTPVT